MFNSQVHWEAGTTRKDDMLFVYLKVVDITRDREYSFTLSDPDDAMIIAEGLIKAAWEVKNHEARN